MKLFEINLENGKKFKKSILTENIEDAEVYAENFYSAEGYKVRNLSPYHLKKQLPDEIIEYIDSQLPLRKTKELSTSGLPDLICWKKTEQGISELFFVEVKFNSGKLSMNQMVWFTEFQELETRVFGIYAEDELTFNPGKLAVNSKEFEKRSIRLNEAKKVH